MSGSDKDDLYDKLLGESADRLDAPQTETARQRKWRILQTKSKQLMGQAYQGAIIGGLVGGGFGFITGFYYAFQTKKLSVIPISTLVSGASFAFIMGCGSMIRSDDGEEYYKTVEINKQQLPIQEFWLKKHQL